VPSNISSIATHEKCCELQLRMAANQVCKPQSHINRGWGLV
jgi:hypothetical protein